MRDIDIRPILKTTLLKEHYSDPNTKVVEEWDLAVANARIDMAVLNGHFHGYEIKSSQDNLERLPNQLVSYSKIFDQLSVITEEKYATKILKIIPDWVGVTICYQEGESAKIECIKPCEDNKSQQGTYLAKLLWQPELKEIYRENNIPINNRLNSWGLCLELSTLFTTPDLSNIVREKLKCRQNWKL